MKTLTSKEVYHLILKGSADKGWQGFAEDIQKALIEKNEEQNESASILRGSSI